MSSKGPRKQGRVVREGVRVSATTAPSGRPATSIHVAVDRDKLGEQVQGLERIEQVVAEVPAVHDGAVEWHAEPMPRLGTEVQAEPQSATRDEVRVVESYGQTLYGPCDASRLGVTVALETNAGTLLAQAPGESYSVRPADEPEPPEPLTRTAGLDGDGP